MAVRAPGVLLVHGGVWAALKAPYFVDGRLLCWCVPHVLGRDNNAAGAGLALVVGHCGDE